MSYVNKPVLLHYKDTEKPDFLKKYGTPTLVGTMPYDSANMIKGTNALMIQGFLVI